MSVSTQKKRPLSRYIKDYKHSQTHCLHCHKALDRISLVFNRQVINKEAISEMTDLIDASRSYEANISAFNASKTMANKGLTIGEQ